MNSSYLFRFNLQGHYLQILMVEMSERHLQELERAYEMTSDQVVPWHMVTIKNA